MKLAQEVTIDGQKIKGRLSDDINNLGDLVNIIIAFLIPVAGIILLIILILGGYGYMMSRGEPEKLKTAKGRITTALIGFALLLTAYLIVRVISGIFGIGEEIFQ